MAGYRMVTYCRLCKKRLLTSKGERISHYCKDCLKKFRKKEDE